MNYTLIKSFLFAMALTFGISSIPISLKASEDIIYKKSFSEKCKNGFYSFKELVEIMAGLVFLTALCPILYFFPGKPISSNDQRAAGDILGALLSAPFYSWKVSKMRNEHTKN
jgi:hypothetical protein